MLTVGGMTQSAYGQLLNDKITECRPHELSNSFFYYVNCQPWRLFRSKMLMFYSKIWRTFQWIQIDCCLPFWNTAVSPYPFIQGCMFYYYNSWHKGLTNASFGTVLLQLSDGPVNLDWAASRVFANVIIFSLWFSVSLLTISISLCSVSMIFMTFAIDGCSCPLPGRSEWAGVSWMVLPISLDVRLLGVVKAP